MQVLDQIDQALVQSLERAVLPEASPPSSGGVADALRALEVLQERLTELQASLDGAVHNAAGADAALVAEIGALQEWRTQAAAVREKLAVCSAGRD
jgi:hypothetical protein